MIILQNLIELDSSVAEALVKTKTVVVVDDNDNNNSKRRCESFMLHELVKLLGKNPADFAKFQLFKGYVAEVLAIVLSVSPFACQNLAHVENETGTKGGTKGEGNSDENSGENLNSLIPLFSCGTFQGPGEDPDDPNSNDIDPSDFYSNGIEYLLTVLSVYRKRNPGDVGGLSESKSEEEEYVENLFQCLGHLVPENQELFNDAEGFQLLFLFIKNVQLYARRPAALVLLLAIKDSPRNCASLIKEVYIEIECFFFFYVFI